MCDCIELRRSLSRILLFAAVFGVPFSVAAGESAAAAKPEPSTSLPVTSKVKDTVEITTSKDADDGNSAAASPDEAASHFELGVEFYKQRKFEQASIEFAMAYDLKPSYKIFFNIGQAENMLEHYAEALKAYRAYLEHSGNEIPEDRRELVEKELKRLINRVGYIEVYGDYRGASVLIDGEEKGRMPLAEPMIVDVGKREVEVLVGTERLFRQVYRVAANQHIVVNLGSKDENGNVQADTTTTSPESSAAKDNSKIDGSQDASKDDAGAADSNGKSARKRNRVIGISLLGVGFAAASAAVATGVIATLKKNDIAEGCLGYVCDEETWSSEFTAVKRLSISTDALIGAAAVSTTVGLILFFVKPKALRNEKVSLHVSPVEGGAFAGVTGRF